MVEVETVEPRRPLQHQQHKHEHHQHKLSAPTATPPQRTRRFAVVCQPALVRRPNNKGRRRRGGRTSIAATFPDAAEATTGRRKRALDARQQRAPVSRRRRTQQHRHRRNHRRTSALAGVQQRLHRPSATTAGRPSRILIGQAKVPQTGSNRFCECCRRCRRRRPFARDTGNQYRR